MHSYRKKLIEVALPLEAINKESAREKSIRHGHPSTLHLWWARRPLAACRAVLFASLVDDPDSDPTFRKPDGSVDEDRAGARRAELFNLIEELVKWENSNNESVLNRARAEIAACVASRKILDTREWKKEQTICGEKAWDFVKRTAKPGNVNAFLAEHAPPVLDPFCGGGSIPLEAQRLGLRAYASDLNPVPVLITKALIEIPPKFANRPPMNPESSGEAGPAGKKGAGRGKSVFEKSEWHGAQGLAEDVRYYGKWMRDEAEKRIGHLYPKVKVTAEMAKDRPDLKPFVGQELTVIAWLWARTVASPNPAVGGAHVPLVRSFWLSTKKGNEAWTQPHITPSDSSVRFRVGTGTPPVEFDPEKGTVLRTGGTCLLTSSPIPFEHIRAEGRAGRLGETLLAVVVENRGRRLYLTPGEPQQAIASNAQPTAVPDTPLPDQALGFRVQLYGMLKHRNLFTVRQLTALTAFSDLIKEMMTVALADGIRAGHSHADASNSAAAVATYLAFALDKGANLWSSLCSWMSDRGALRETFARQALSMIWDYAEANPFSDSGGNFGMFVDRVADAIDAVPARPQGTCDQRDAVVAYDLPQLPIVSTDPPYYDNIGYADLSDFFYIWLRRSLSSLYPSLFATLLTPKTQELIATPFRHSGSRARAQQFFEAGLGKAFDRMREQQQHDYPLTVFYAFKQAESDEDGGDDEDRGSSIASTGWETMLEGIIQAGFAITGTWPMRTEGTGRIRNLGSNALASSILLVCRPRPDEAALGTRKELITALRKELPVALRSLQRGSVAPVDVAQAAIGPGMAVFTRYAKVMEADGSPMKVRQALALINQTLDEVLAEQEGEFDGDTRWALAWFEQFGMEDGAFGVAETLSKAKNTAVNGLVEAGIVHSRAGKVRLLKRDELPADWDPATDTRLRHWEIVQYLIRALETGGETAAAALLRKLGGMGEAARDLAYRLYSICERKKWASEALAYNSLVIAWPEISKLARGIPRQVNRQGEMFAG